MPLSNKSVGWKSKDWLLLRKCFVFATINSHNERLLHVKWKYNNWWNRSRITLTGDKNGCDAETHAERKPQKRTQMWILLSG